MAEPINEGDLVKLTGENVGHQPEVLKVERIHYVRSALYQQRTGRDRQPIAECLIPPYEDKNKFQNWPVDDLEKVPEPKTKKK